MLTSIEIENFKGIGARQRIEFAPLTLLFGANSAGKSSILQALLYLHELIERGSADVDRTELGGNLLELGGFARLVHKHDAERAIVLRAEFLTPGGLERFGRDLTDFPFPDLEDEVESAWLELTIRFRTTANHHGPMVERAVFGVNGDPEALVWLEVGATLREGEPLQARVNMGHPVLASETRELPGAMTIEADGTQRQITVPHAPAQVTEDWEQIAIPEEVLHRGLEAVGFGGGSGAGAGLGDGSGFGDGRSLPVFALARGRMSALPAPGEPLRIVPFGDDTPEKAITAQQVRTFLEMVVLGTMAQLAGFLRESLYLGPLRAIPEFTDLYERPRSAASWGDGREAWQTLLTDRLDLVQRTNEQLARLGADCRVFVSSVFEASGSAGEGSTIRVHTLRLETRHRTRLLPREMGSGVSQLMPVIVASLTERSGLLTIEQPELHVHPALQTGLGDLFIEAASQGRKRRTLLVETHSEHLLLRVMRRMRETHEGTVPEGVRPVFPGDVSIVLVEKDGDRSITRKMPLNERGELVKAWPGGFFEEGLREVL